MVENGRHVYEDIEAEGHLIDSNILSRIMSGIVELGDEFEVLSFEVGRDNDDPSRIAMRVFGTDDAHLAEMLRMLHGLGVVPMHPHDVAVAPAPADGVFPEGFYATTNLETFVRIDGFWYAVAGTEMDLGICVDVENKRAWGVPISEVRKGDPIAVGQMGIRVTSQERLREKEEFEFMNSTASSEKPKVQIIRQTASLLRDARASGRAIIAVVGPAVIHTGAAEHLRRLVRAGYVSVLFGGNAVATHDIESALYGTSLGIDLETGCPVPGGHEHHLRAINRIRGCGSIRAAVEQGVLERGLMHALVETDTPYVLAGSIRDDGPLPDVITDTVRAQEAMRSWCQEAGACLMLSTMLHSIATGNLLPASVTTVCVDINPAVVTKLSDRGSFQTIGIITDVGLFLKLLADELGCEGARKQDDSLWGICGDWAPENFDLFQRIVSYRLDEGGERATIVAPAPGRVIAADKMHPIRAPKYDYGQPVAPANHPERHGTIALIGYHFKYERPFYFIEINGKQKKRRYFSDELIPLDLL